MGTFDSCNRLLLRVRVIYCSMERVAKMRFLWGEHGLCSGLPRSPSFYLLDDYHQKISCPCLILKFATSSLPVIQFAVPLNAMAFGSSLFFRDSQSRIMDPIYSAENLYETILVNIEDDFVYYQLASKRSSRFAVFQFLTMF